MGLFSRFEDKAENVIEGASGRGRGGIEPVKLAKRAFKEMQREKMVGVGHEYAPTLYNVLVSPEDDDQMSGFYPSLAGEIETYLTAKAKSAGLVFDCPPLVRFIVDDGLKRGRFDCIAESVSPAIISDLRDEEMEHYGIKKPQPAYEPPAQQAQPVQQPAYEPPAQQAQPAGAQRATGYDSLVATPSAQPAPAQPSAEPADAPAADPVIPEAYSPAGVQEIPERAYPPTEAPLPGSGAGANRSADKTVFVGTVAAQPHPQATLFDFASQIRHPLNGVRVIVGRGNSCDVIVSDPSVSRHHAEILHDETGWMIRDTGSTNGTQVNGARASQSRIYSGDLIKLGTAELEFQEG